MRNRPGKAVILIVMLLVLVMCISCSVIRETAIPVGEGGQTISPEYESLAYKIDILLPTKSQRKMFNKNVKAEYVSVTKNDGTVVEGFVSGNKEFLETIITPLVKPYLADLSKKNSVDLINLLSLFSYELYRVYFGDGAYSWEYYRWGGDIFDLDDPQQEGYRHDYRYGLDCSGYVSMPYELAVYFGLMNATDPSAVFSSQGFELYCKKFNIADRGGRGGSSNRYRLDTSDLMNLGKVIFTIEKGGKPRLEEIRLLQPGDIAVGPGHSGIIVGVNGVLYYLELGRTVLPPEGKTMTPVMEGLTQFVKDYPLTIRRTLPDYSTVQK